MELNGNLADLVSAAARRGPEHPAFTDPVRGQALSWSEVESAVAAEAARLATAGVGPGDRVLVRLRQGIPLCVALLGALRAGAVVVPVGTQSTPHELSVIVADCAPAALVAEPDDQVVRGLPTPSAVAPVLDPPGLGAVSPVDAAPPPRGGEDIAVLGYTSGATGVPRGVRLSHRALLANREQTAALRPAPVSPADRVLLHLPLFHIYGLGAGLLQVCWAGATGVLVDRVDPDGVLEAIERERVTVVAGVPSMYRALLELPEQRLREALVTVRLCTAGGAPLAAELLTRFHQVTGLDLFEGYGLTETGPVLTSALASGRPKPGSVGRPLPGVELRLVDVVSGAPLGAGAEDVGDEDPDDQLGSAGDGYDTGLVSVRGPNLFSGYWPDGEGGPDGDGWFRTSDVGHFDADGDLFLVDRANDLIIVNGFNVYPREVEQVLCEHPGVAEAAVVGVPDERTGEAVMAVLVPRPGATLTPEDVRAHCATRLARFKVPRVVELVDRLPHTATGKITRAALRAAEPVVSAPRVTLMTRRDCSLCDTAAEAVARICAEVGVGWTSQDVDTDVELRAEYGDRVPVVLVDGREHGYYRVEEDRLRAALLG